MVSSELVNSFLLSYLFIYLFIVTEYYKPLSDGVTKMEIHCGGVSHPRISIFLKYLEKKVSLDMDNYFKTTWSCPKILYFSKQSVFLPLGERPTSPSWFWTLSLSPLYPSEFEPYSDNVHLRSYVLLVHGQVFTLWSFAFGPSVWLAPLEILWISQIETKTESNPNRVKNPKETSSVSLNYLYNSLCSYEP